MRWSVAALSRRLCLGAVFLVVGCDQADPPGKPAPDFTLSDLTGREVSLSDYKGRPVLLSFWAVG